MKTLPLILLLSCYCWCKDTLVIDLLKQSSEGKTVLSLDKRIQITNSMTFCLRLNLKDTLSMHYIFNEKDDKLGFKLKFSVGLGSAAINKRVFQFKIPKDNGPIFLRRFRLYVLFFMFRFMFVNICFEKNQNIKIHVMFITKHNMK